MMCKNSNISIVYLCAIITAGYGKEASKLIGGTSVIIERYPYVVSILWQGFHICSGSIISELHILTTATCVTSEKNIIFTNLQVLSGTDYQFNIYGHGEIYNVGLVIIHNDYEPSKFCVNDISILKLEKLLSFTVSQKPARIYIPLLRMDRRKSFTMIGWEQFSDTIKLSKFDIILDSPYSCDKFSTEFAEVNIGQNCFKTKQTAQKITNGDSGNSISTYYESMLYGIVSLVLLEPDNEFIGTQLSVYNNWIYNIIATI